MKTLGWIVLLFGFLECALAGVVGTIAREAESANAIAIGLGALAAVFAGIKLIDFSRSR